MALTTNLSSYWKMDESSGNAADSHGSNTLTNHGTTTFTTGKINNASSMNGSSQYFDVADHTSLRMNSAFSFQAWIYQPTSVTGAGTLLNKWDGGGGPVFHTPSGDGANLKLFHTGSGSDYATTSGLGMSADTWYHVVLVYDGSGSTNADKIKIYVNGSSQSLTFNGAAIPSTMPDNTGNFYVGLWPTLSYYFKGRMDEVAFWQRALTGAEVTSLYGAGSGLAYPLAVTSGNAYYFANQ